jgi:hypothetical protein
MTEESSAAVVVWLGDALWGVDPDTGDMFKSSRHVVYADRVVQDVRMTTFIDEDGEVVGEWLTRTSFVSIGIEPRNH